MVTAVRCPSCRSEFELSAVMRAQLEGEVRTALSKELEKRFAREAEERLRSNNEELAELRRKVAEGTRAQTELLKKERELSDREQRLELDVEKRLADERRRIREQEAKAAQERFSREAEERVRATQEELHELQSKLKAAKSKEAELAKKERQLAEREAEQAVETERRIAAEVARAREQHAKVARQQAELQEQQQKLAAQEHRQTIDALNKQVADLQRRLQQGSQQAQGEAQEVVLRELLAGSFTDDDIEDVPKGVKGADLLQVVRTPQGDDCGTIVWESKRTKTWSETWLPKVRDDQREAGAAFAVIVTQALPQDIRSFGVKGGVWVCAPQYVVGLGLALRRGLLDVALARRAAEGSDQKMQLLYDYLTGAEFRNRVEGLVEAFVQLQGDLDGERRAMQTRWKRREKMIERALCNVTAFYGDLQGIAGRQLRDLPPLSLESVRALPEPVGDEEGDGMEQTTDMQHLLNDERLKQLLIGLLPRDGSTVGNGSLSDLFVAGALTQLRLHVTVEDYKRCKEALLTSGRIRRGRGRGGSVGRILDSAAE